MDFPQVLKRKMEEEDPFLENLKELSNSVDFSINDKVPLPIFSSFSFKRDDEVEVKYPSGIVIGKLKFLKNKIIEDVNALPDDERICFYKDYNKEEIVDNKHTFHNDYFLIQKKYFLKYIKMYKKTSSIWGSFYHLEDVPSITFYKKKRQEFIKIQDKLIISQDIYSDNLYLSINEPNPFNRFLKLYHLIELQFDMHTAEKIKALVEEGGKEREISSKLKEYVKDDIERLTSIIKERCTDYKEIKKYLDGIKPFESKALKIFYEYGRGSNPLKKSDFSKILTKSELFEPEIIHQLGYHYESFIPKLSAYWIYRIRSSIAHNKLGEYIMDIQDEGLIVEFAEPLLKEIVKQCFKK